MKKKPKFKARPPKLSWLKVLDSYSDLYCMDTGLREAATLAAATLVTGKLPGDPVWTFIVGPASTSKTVIVESMAADNEHCLSVSKLTAKQMVSGWKDPEDPDKEVSIFPLLKTKALCIKDFTTVLSMGAGVQEELFGILRDCYDGKVEVRYGNGKHVLFENIYFPMLAAVTDAIKNYNHSHMGERFLRCEVLGPGHDTENVIEAALDSTVKDPARDAKLQALGRRISTCLSSLQIDITNLPPIDEEVRDRLKALSQVIGYVRAVVVRHGDELLYRPRPEGGSRVAKQLLKVGYALTYLLGKPSVDMDVYHLMKKLGLDTVNGIPLEILQTVMKRNEQGFWSTDIVRKAMRLPKTTTSRRLQNLEELGILERHYESNGKRDGRDIHIWQPTPEFGSLWERAGLIPSKRRFVV